jgi:hypothetical protein
MSREIILIILLVACIPIIFLTFGAWMQYLTKTVAEEIIAAQEKRLLPKPNDINIRIYNRAGMDVPIYILSLEYRCSSEEQAKQLEKQLVRRIKQ